MTAAEKKARDAVVRAAMDAYKYDVMFNLSWTARTSNELERVQRQACARLQREEAKGSKRKGVRREK